MPVKNQNNTKKKHIYIALGSNLGDREKLLAAAIASLHPSVTVLKESPVYQTAPWGYEEQPAFLNQVVLASTHLSPEELLTYLKNIEHLVGRKPTFKYGPREVDLDILFYDDLVFRSAELEIPHPRIAERAFVVVPLNDLAPSFRHPVSRETVSSMLQNLDISSVSLYRP